MSVRPSERQTTLMPLPTASVVQAAPPSLPPVVQGVTPIPPVTQPKAITTIKRLKFPKGTALKKKALAVLAMRAQGFKREEIATALGVAPFTVNVWVYRANQRGLIKLEDTLSVDDAIEGTLTTKTLRNVDQFLDDPDADRRFEATKHFAEHTIYKKYDAPKETHQNMNVLSVRIEMPESGPQVERPGSMGGQPQSYLDIVPETGDGD